MSELTPLGICEKCGIKSVLVHDMKKPSGYKGFSKPSVCIDCWRCGNWKEMKRWYLTALAQVFFILPFMTFGMWMFYAFYMRYQPHWDDKKGLYVFLFLPSILCVGTIPQVLLRLLLMSRYGPKLERISGLLRWVVGAMPDIVYAIVSILALILFFYIRDGNVR